MDVYIYQADIYCDDCGVAYQKDLENTVPTLDRDDSDNWPRGPYGDGGGEADSPQHCGDCHIHLENPLTPDGERYVIAAVASGAGVVAGDWLEYYGYLF